MRHLVRMICFLLLSCAFTWAQAPCPTTSTSDKMICVIPQLFGPAGLILPVTGHQAHFISSFQGSFTPLNTAVGSQLTQLPLASPASGVIFTFDKSLGVAVRSADSLGPLLTERAETIGRRKLYLAFTYQYFNFEQIDGVQLNDLPAVFTHVDLAAPSPGFPDFERDVVFTQNDIRLRVHQYTLFGSFGLTNRVDVSLAVPLLNVNMEANSDATIITNGSAVNHFFDPVTLASNTQFSESRSASGIGDLTIRIKGTAYKGEHHSVAVATDIRVPTGDELNFLGSGAVGIKPFGIWSYRARVSPHVNVGYEWNGDSILSGDISTGQKASLPDQFFYSVGADVAFNRKVTLSFDLLGRRVLDSRRVVRGTFTDLGNTLGTTRTYDNVGLSAGEENFNVTNAALGFKVSPWKNLQLTGNLLFKLDDGGLRAKVVPLAGLSYTF